jgi:hypothetical protein
MYPTLEKNDWVLTSSRRNGLHRGDVVVLRYFCVLCVVSCACAFALRLTAGGTGRRTIVDGCEGAEGR